MTDESNDTPRQKLAKLSESVQFKATTAGIEPPTPAPKKANTQQ